MRTRRYLEHALMPLSHSNALRPMLRGVRPWSVLHYVGGHNREADESEEQQGPPDKG